MSCCRRVLRAFCVRVHLVRPPSHLTTLVATPDCFFGPHSKTGYGDTVDNGDTLSLRSQQRRKSDSAQSDTLLDNTQLDTASGKLDTLRKMRYAWRRTNNHRFGESRAAKCKEVYTAFEMRTESRNPADTTLQLETSYGRFTSNPMHSNHRSRVDKQGLCLNVTTLPLLHFALFLLSEIIPFWYGVVVVSATVNTGGDCLSVSFLPPLLFEEERSRKMMGKMSRV